MTRRLESGPLLVTVGALLLLVSLFLTWYSGQFDLTAWDAFEVWDLVLAALGARGHRGVRRPAGPGGRGGRPPLAARHRASPRSSWSRWRSSTRRPPRWAATRARAPGSRSARRSLMAAGAVLTFSRVRLAFTVEGRDPRRHVSGRGRARGAGARDGRTAAAPPRPGRPAAACSARRAAGRRGVAAGTAARRRRRPSAEPRDRRGDAGGARPRRARRTTSRCCAAAPGGASARRETGDAPEKDPG